MFQVSAVSGRTGNFSEAGSIVLKPLPNHGKYQWHLTWLHFDNLRSAHLLYQTYASEPRNVHISSDKVSTFCGSSCSDPQFAHGPVLYVLKDGHLYFSKVASGHWSAPLPVAGVNNVIAYRISPDSQQVFLFSCTQPLKLYTRWQSTPAYVSFYFFVLVSRWHIRKLKWEIFRLPSRG